MKRTLLTSTAVFIMTIGAQAKCSNLSFLNWVKGRVPIEECHISYDKSIYDELFKFMEKETDTCSSTEDQKAINGLQSERANYPNEEAYCTYLQKTINLVLDTYKTGKEIDAFLKGGNLYSGPHTHACNPIQTKSAGKLQGLFVAGTLACNKWPGDREAVVASNEALKNDSCVQNGIEDAEDDATAGHTWFHELVDKNGEEYTCKMIDKFMSQIEMQIKARFGK